MRVFSLSNEGLPALLYAGGLWCGSADTLCGGAAADPIGESVRQARGAMELGSDMTQRVQNSFKTGAELLQSVTENNTDIANPVDVASLCVHNKATSPQLDSRDTSDRVFVVTGSAWRRRPMQRRLRTLCP